jgi:hypothetical protein
VLALVIVIRHGRRNARVTDQIRWRSSSTVPFHNRISPSLVTSSGIDRDKKQPRKRT